MTLRLSVCVRQSISGILNSTSSPYLPKLSTTIHRAHIDRNFSKCECVGEHFVQHVVVSTKFPRKTLQYSEIVSGKLFKAAEAVKNSPILCEFWENFSPFNEENPLPFLKRPWKLMMTTAMESQLSIFAREFSLKTMKLTATTTYWSNFVENFFRRLNDVTFSPTTTITTTIIIIMIGKWKILTNNHFLSSCVLVQEIFQQINMSGKPTSLWNNIMGK